MRLSITKATSLDIEHILITNSLDSNRKVVDLSIHSEQAYSLTVYFTLKSFFLQLKTYRVKLK